MKVVLALVFAVAVSAVPVFQVRVSSEESQLFERFKSQYGRSYSDAREETYRRTIFVANLRKIRLHNEEQAEGKHTYTLAMNEFGDMPFEEFHAKYTGYKGIRNEYLRTKNLADLSTVTAASSIDWTTKGAVTPVKNQGQCGSCWAFSTTGSVEGAWFIKQGTLVSLSEQQLMDCSKSQGNDSCEGGLMDQAFEYLEKSGSCTEKDYPYAEADHSSCNSCSAAAHITSFKDVAQTESDLEAAVTLGPVSVAIEADQDSFQFYSSGVMTGDCGTQLDHGVLAVGYGTLNGVEYWKVKNSWGSSWGMNGYILLQKGKQQTGGQCGILLAASYPIV